MVSLRRSFSALRALTIAVSESIREAASTPHIMLEKHPGTSLSCFKVHLGGDKTMPGSRITRYAQVYAWSGMRVPPCNQPTSVPHPEQSGGQELHQPLPM